jgi:hypothetical protein
MFDRPAAYQLAHPEVRDGLAIRETSARELTDGWYFPFHATGPPMVGAKGVIVHKRTGERLVFGSAYPLEDELAAYELGYQFDRYDLVVLGAPDLDAAVDVLARLQLRVVEPDYRDGTVWRIPRTLRPRELRERLAKLPCVFPGAGLNPHYRLLEAACAAGVLRFEALKYGGR